MTQLHSFACGHTVVPAPFGERVFFPPLIWHLCGKSTDHRYMGLFLDSQFYYNDLSLDSTTLS